MNIITIEEQSFYELLNKVLEEMEQKFGKKEPEWIAEPEAMQILGLRSKTSMQRLRDNDEVKYTQPRKKIVLYSRSSLLSYLESHANK